MTPAGSRTLLVGVVPTAVALVETFGERGGGHLFPEEAAAVAQAVPARRREFSTVRWCARQALARLGCPPVAIPPDLGHAQGWARRAPVWPPGYVGSMTHCDGYRAAAVSTDTAVTAIGIDAEPHLPLPEGVLPLVSTNTERAHLIELARAAPGIAWDRVLFSAKESIFKAWYPTTGEWLGFEECEVVIDTLGPGAGAFTGTVAPGRSVTGGAQVRPGRFEGSWRISSWPGRPTLVGTVVVVAARAVGAAPQDPLPPEKSTPWARATRPE